MPARPKYMGPLRGKISRSNSTSSIKSALNSSFFWRKIIDNITINIILVFFFTYLASLALLGDIELYNSTISLQFLTNSIRYCTSIFKYPVVVINICSIKG
eukprot:NODE_9_length_64580_cov_1.431941.p54 type:complete len:101 gc:universal NODE_9_length_64580_cov_1.431941:33077-33379(+)